MFSLLFLFSIFYGCYVRFSLSIPTQVMSGRLEPDVITMIGAFLEFGKQLITSCVVVLIWCETSYCLFWYHQRKTHAISQLQKRSLQPDRYFRVIFLMPFCQNFLIFIFSQIDEIWCIFPIFFIFSQKYLLKTTNFFYSRRKLSFLKYLITHPQNELKHHSNQH